MVRKSSKFLQQQKILVGAVAAIALAVLAYFSSWVITEQPLGEFQESVHYQVLDNPRRIRGDKLEIMEFFSYGCVHCFNFDRPLADWVEDNQDRIKFIRIPAVANELWRIYGRTYFALEAMGITEDHHMALFLQIHDLKADLSTPEKLANWIDGRGVDRAGFLAAFNSAAVSTEITNADRMGRRLKVASVPTIIVNGKYLVKVNRQVGPARMLEVMDHLVQQELAPPGG